MTRVCVQNFATVRRAISAKIANTTLNHLVDTAGTCLMSTLASKSKSTKCRRRLFVASLGDKSRRRHFVNFDFEWRQCERAISHVEATVLMTFYCLLLTFLETPIGAAQFLSNRITPLRHSGTIINRQMRFVHCSAASKRDDATTSPNRPSYKLRS